MASNTLNGKVVAITGAARGIGFATATALRALGAKVCIGDVDAVLAAESAQKIGALASALDVRDRASFHEFLETTRRAYGPIDVLINNAGIMPMGLFVDESDELTNAQIDINLRGVIHGMKLALPAMQARGCGHIVNVASVAGRLPIPGASVYCATKYAVVGMTAAVREEMRGSGVNFTVVMPSKVSTDLSGGTEDGGGMPTASPEEVADTIIYAIEHRLLEVTVPRYLRPLPVLFSMAPRWMEKRMRKLVKDDRILTNLDRRTRADYEKRLSDLSAAPEDKPAVKAAAKKTPKIKTEKA